ncbi:hypothetical protein B0H14DRAFT_2734573 [Mycena olivaceomarginata]|nr:hypothetical protein B0H14DRAFT_2734573 [Mycena olivaceomarginata]
MTGNSMSLFGGPLLSYEPLATAENRHIAPSHTSPDDSLFFSGSLLWPPLQTTCASLAYPCALSIGSSGTRALCCRPPSARRCNLVVPTVLHLSHTRAPVSQLARVVAPSCAKGCTICPCDLLTRARVHALLVPIIGSANINEQSQLGDRDSELAAVIRGAPTARTFTYAASHSAATEYMPRHRASSYLHCGGDYGAWDRGRRASEAGNVALRLGVERGEGVSYSCSHQFV